MSKKAALKTLQSIYSKALQAPRYNDGSEPHTLLTGLQALQTNDKNAVGDSKNDSTRKEAR
mgnify:CR=1 FL=1